MDILLTGSTAAHVSQKKNEKTRTFHGDLNKAFNYSHHRVTWIEPSVSMSREYIADFDYVVVGLAPPTSTAAHRIYGSLSVIKHAWEEGNLVLVIDAPEPRRIWTGLKAINNNPDSLLKDFYSKRSEYRKATKPEVFDRINSAVELLVNSEWPTTLFPTLPWMSFSSVSYYIPRTSEESLVGLNFDSSMIGEDDSLLPEKSPRFWASDYYNSAWTKKQEDLIGLPVVPLRTSRWEGDADAVGRLTESIGCLISTHRSGDPWWSPAIAQAFYAGVPVVTDWTLSSILGNSWRMLPAAVEGLTQGERHELVISQKESYRKALLDWQSSVELLNRALVS